MTPLGVIGQYNLYKDKRRYLGTDGITQFMGYTLAEVLHLIKNTK